MLLRRHRMVREAAESPAPRRKRRQRKPKTGPKPVPVPEPQNDEQHEDAERVDELPGQAAIDEQPNDEQEV